MSNRRVFACPNCSNKLPLKHIFLLNNNSEIDCEKCGYRARPERMGMWYIAATFFAVAVPGQVVLWKTGSFTQAVAVGLAIGVLTYIGILVYVYNKVRFL